MRLEDSRPGRKNVKFWAVSAALVGPAPRRAESPSAALLIMLRGMFGHKKYRYNRVTKGKPRTPGECGGHYDLTGDGHMYTRFEGNLTIR